MPAVALLPFFPTCYHRVNPPSISPSLLLAAHPLPFTLLPVNLASCLHFKLMDLPRKDKEGEPRRQIDIFIYTYIDIHVYWEKKKKKKKRGKQVERLSRLCLTYTLVQKRGFVYFFSPRVRPSRIIAPPGKILDEILVARTWRWMSTLEIYTADGCEKKARAGSRESTAWTLGYKPGWREGCRNGKIVERFFKRRCLKFTLQIGRRSEIFGGRAARMSVTYCTW